MKASSRCFQVFLARRRQQADIYYQERRAHITHAERLSRAQFLHSQHATDIPRRLFTTVMKAIVRPPMEPNSPLHSCELSAGSKVGPYPHIVANKRSVLKPRPGESQVRNSKPHGGETESAPSQPSLIVALQPQRWRHTLTTLPFIHFRKSNSQAPRPHRWGPARLQTNSRLLASH